MIVPILVGLATVIGLFVILIAARPSDFRVTRSATVAALPEQVFPYVNELRNWEAWNPWGKMDPNCRMTYDGPPAGVGASYAWAGNPKVGEGRNTITESESNELVRFRLEFAKPMKATNTAEFTFRPDNGQTVVTWTMSGKHNFAGKAFGLIVNCDQMIGGQFEKGLAQMKSLVEAATEKMAVNL